jgi:hypothetical protein
VALDTEREPGLHNPMPDLAITAIRIVTTAIATFGVILYVYLIFMKQTARQFRIYGLIALFWLSINYLIFWVTGSFPDAFFVAGGLYAAIHRN